MDQGQPQHSPPPPHPAPGGPPGGPAPAASGHWGTVDALHAWLEESNRRPPAETLLLRVLKLSEEVGEVAQAVIGATGQNPRKGRSHSWADVEAELCDVIITAMVALRTLSPEARHLFDAHLARVAERSLSATGPASTTAPAPAPAPATEIAPEAN
ncbi:hypothetical protein SLNWT_5565 [Streptomyces albus]|uniref:NTP pyrophosphohydrolase MazG putative catalytic core domain-containing protein n=1 Tax=Streptomyces albus (strain ATCC 21838 / DSM 41398 / FERM P-419 / JCM 4703 / NBRC 107858) TaxID=1081613 RepID=A0A0B5F4Z2_STRA4|nr:hypothetical protein SLNWT_5565 [Streptomyces albus]AOU80244.1 hypothetical protein SLNHY_5553 [Streptomyces albus]AYN35958.1 hypothetical protein DUI70_5463 [Streptomyces albus]